MKPKRKLRPPAKRKKLVKVRGAARDIFNPAGRDPEWASSLRGFFLRGLGRRRSTALRSDTRTKRNEPKPKSPTVLPAGLHCAPVSERAMLRAFGDTMKATLTDGRVVELQPEDFNPVGQIYVAKLVERGLADDASEMCELLGAAPCDMRYGMVHPGVDLIE